MFSKLKAYLMWLLVKPAYYGDDTLCFSKLRLTGKLVLLVSIALRIAITKIGFTLIQLFTVLSSLGLALFLRRELNELDALAFSMAALLVYLRWRADE